VMGVITNLIVVDKLLSCSHFKIFCLKTSNLNVLAICEVVSLGIVIQV
jgi:hypothetical protein